VAEMYRLQIGEKTRDALAHLRAAGRRYSNVVPYGWRATRDGRLVPDSSEQAAVALMRKLPAKGLSLRKVSAALADRGILARNGGPFEAKTLSRLVADRTIGHSETHSA